MVQMEVRAAAVKQQVVNLQFICNSKEMMCEIHRNHEDSQGCARLHDVGLHVDTIRPDFKGFATEMSRKQNWKVAIGQGFQLSYYRNQ